MNTVWSHRLLLGGLAVLLALAACGGTPTPPPPAAAPIGSPTMAVPSTPAPATAPAAAEAPAAALAGKILRIRQPVFPQLADPHKAFGSEIAVLALNYEGLTRLDKNLKTVPAAAEKWEFSPDGTELTFHLRDGLAYSDGAPLTAEHFRFAVERTCDPATAGLYQSILFVIQGCADFASTPVTDTARYTKARQAVGVEAPDARTLVLKLTQPAPYLPTVASLWVFYPARKELIEAGGEDWWKDPTRQIGNGPFQVTRIEDDQIIALTANPHYWGGRPKLDGIEYIYLKETTLALEAYKAGQLDIADVDPSQIPAVKSDPLLSKELVIFPQAATVYLAFNLRKEPFTDKKVREAFSYAFDRQTYCEQIRSGTCLAALSWIPQGVPGAITSDKYGFDPAKARQALAESQYGGPAKLPPIKYTYSSDDPAEQPRAEWIAGQFREVLGVNIRLDPLESKTVIALTKDPATFPQMLIGAWIQDYPDPQNWLSLYWTCNSMFAKLLGYCNKQFDELVQKADVELDPNKRIAYYEQAGQILVDDVPGLFLYNPAGVFLVKPFVTGYQPTASDWPWPGQWASLLTIDVNK